MNYDDNQFDMSFTILVLEQMPHKFEEALVEMHRVTRKYCVFIEPFFEANKRAVQQSYLKHVDYFCSSYKKFSKYGLKPIYFSNKFPQKQKFGVGVLIAEVIS